MKVDAVLLAGDRKGSTPIREENKAFLLLCGVPLFIRVVQTLLGTVCVNRVFIVGPARRVVEALDRHDLEHGAGRRIEVIEQRENLLDNGKAGFLATLPGNLDPATRLSELSNSEFADRVVLFLPCDIPLATPEEIDEFVTGSDMVNYDYSVGVCSEAVLSPYYPTSGRPGIVMAYFHVREGTFRQNNLHLGKPLRVERVVYMERMYDLRYQRRLINIIRLVLELMASKKKVFRSVRLFLQMQLSFFLSSRGRSKLYEFVRRRTPQYDILSCLNEILGTRIQTVETHYGGAALDIDNAPHLKIAETMYGPWMAQQLAIRKHGGTPRSEG